MKILTEYGGSVNAKNVEIAVEALKKGDILVYPTDTFYALGVDALNNRAVERLCKLKGISPEKNVLSIVCSGMSQAAEYVKIDNRAFRLLKSNLPGPFTFILPVSSSLPKVFRGRKAVGVRIPGNDFARALAELLGNPIMSASVDVYNGEEGEAEASDPRALGLRYSNVPDISVLVDGGAGLTKGSTVVDCLDSSEPVVIRQGLGDLVI